jgi:hypothetical protein
VLYSWGGRVTNFSKCSSEIALAYLYAFAENANIRLWHLADNSRSLVFVCFGPDQSK